MRQKPETRHTASERLVKDIQRKTRKQYGAEEKIRIVLDGLRGEDSIAELCRKEGIFKITFYRRFDRYLTGGIDALEDQAPRPKVIWNRIPQKVHDQIIELALERSELSPRELAVTFTDSTGY